MFLVIDPLGTGEWWKPLRALRPNWVWWSVDEGWSIDDDDPYQKVYGPVASVFGSAADLTGTEDAAASASAAVTGAALGPAGAPPEGAAEGGDPADAAHGAPGAPAGAAASAPTEGPTEGGAAESCAAEGALAAPAAEAGAAAEAKEAEDDLLTTAERARLAKGKGSLT